MIFPLNLSPLGLAFFSHHFRTNHDLGINLSPSSNANPFPLFPLFPSSALCNVGLPLPLDVGGGTKASKFKPLLAALAAAGVLLRPGVRPPQGAWAGDGVTLTKSAKLNCWPGVEKRARLFVGFVFGVERKEGRLLLVVTVC